MVMMMIKDQGSGKLSSKVCDCGKIFSHYKQNAQQALVM